MNFEHLDDASPVEPDAAMRSDVARRARRLRQRRAIIPAAALLAIAGAAIVAITMLSNESTAPSRVVAGPTTTPTTAADADSIGAAVTRGAIHVEASIPSASVRPGARVPVTVIVESLHAPARLQLRMQTCIVDPPLGKGWTGFDPGASCPTSTVTLPSTRAVNVIAPERPGDYSVFLRWSKPPSGDFLPIPLRVVEHVSAETSPALVTVPNVIGMTVEAATQRLQAAGLGAQVRAGSLSLVLEWPPGVVASMEPDAASRVTRVPRGATITLTVSPGTATTPDTLQVAPHAP